MPTLFLLRHAQAASFSAGAGDAARTLTDHGHDQARRVGDVLASAAVGHVLCSSAKRTRQPLDGLALDCPVEYLDAIYNAGSETIMSCIGEVDPTVETLLVIGHAPGIPTVAHQLAREGSDADAVRTLDRGYPTATLTRVDVDAWDTLETTRVTHVYLTD